MLPKEASSRAKPRDLLLFAYDTVKIFPLASLAQDDAFLVDYSVTQLRYYDTFKEN